MFVACGLNHKTAPLDVREKVASSADMQNTLLNSLVGLSTVNEAALLSTCNRTEIYCETDDPTSLAPWLAAQHDLPTKSVIPYFYSHQGHQGVRHALRVASGLDSMMLGEPQILGQMKQAYQKAHSAGTIKHNLREIFPYIFGASKRVRTQSGIGNNPVSVAFAAVQLIGKLFSDYRPLTVFIIGSGETASLVAKYLHKEGVTQFMVASRTRTNAETLAADFSAQALTIADIPQHLSKADVVVSATACPLPFITKSLVEHTIRDRAQKPMFFLDLAVPRDIEAQVKELNHVHLYNIDDLQAMTQKGMDSRRCAAKQAEQLIDCELDNYIRWHRSRQAKELICDYRSQMQELAQQELRRALKKMASGGCQESVLTELSMRLVNKLTHAPSVGIRQAAWDGRSDLLELTQYLFNASMSNASYEEIN